MAKLEWWLLFADDAGDPGLLGTSHFGYAIVGVRRVDMPAFIQARAEFRVATSTYGESKGGNVRSDKFGKAISLVARDSAAGKIAVAASFIAKSKYMGAWLRPSGQSPAAPLYLRNYLIRKTIESLFDGIALQRSSADLVLDRVDYSDAQISNLRQYLSGEFNTSGNFLYPRITHITHADSIYVEGLQLADHVARLAYDIMSNPGHEDQYSSDFLRIQTIIGAKDFEMKRDALEVRLAND